MEIKNINSRLYKKEIFLIRHKKTVSSMCDNAYLFIGKQSIRCDKNIRIHLRWRQTDNRYMETACVYS